MMAWTGKGLRLWNFVPSRESESSCRCSQPEVHGNVEGLPKLLQNDINSLEIELIEGQFLALTLQTTIFEGIQGAQELDPELSQIREAVKDGTNTEFSLSSDGVLNFKGRLCIPNDEELQN